MEGQSRQTQAGRQAGSWLFSSHRNRTTRVSLACEPSLVLPRPWVPEWISLACQAPAVSRHHGVLPQIWLGILKSGFTGDFPGDPVGKTLCSQCRGPGIDPWLEELDPTCMAQLRARVPQLRARVPQLRARVPQLRAHVPQLRPGAATINR